MLCGTSERVPVSASIHLRPRKRKSMLSELGRRIPVIMYVLEPPLPPVRYSAFDTAAQLSAKHTHRVHVDRFQIIRVRVIRLRRTVGIKCARHFKELLLKVRRKTTCRDCKGTVCAVSRPPTRSLIPLNLHSLRFRPNEQLTPLAYSPFSGAG
jgi:hypothetical protein